jgi:hypothetical protein
MEFTEKQKEIIKAALISHKIFMEGVLKDIDKILKRSNAKIVYINQVDEIIDIIEKS